AMNVTKKLTRSTTDRVVAGACGGIAGYFNVDPAIVRARYVLVSLISAGFPRFIVYLVLWFIMPEGSSGRSSATRRAARVVLAALLRLLRPGFTLPASRGGGFGEHAGEGDVQPVGVEVAADGRVGLFERHGLDLGGEAVQVAHVEAAFGVGEERR